MRWVKLEECCTVQGGATPKRNVGSFWGEGLDWFTPKDLSSLNTKEIGRAPEQVTDEGLNSCSAKLIPANSLLLSSRAPIGHLAITTQDCCTNQGFQSLIPKQGVVDIEYLYFVMKWSVPRLQDMGRGATFKEISKAIVKGFEIPLPPLEEQKRIAGILDEADRVRKKTQALIDKYDELAQSLFLDMFGDPVTNPKGWEVVQLGEKLVAKGGKRLPKGADYSVSPTEWPYLRVADMRVNAVELSELKFLTEEVQSKISRYTISKDDVFISIAGTIGVAGWIPDELDGCNLTENAAKIVGLREARLRKEFLSFFLNSHFVQREIEARTMAVGVPKLALFRIESLPLMLPPLELQEEFLDRLGKIQACKIRLEQNDEGGKNLFNALLQKAFKGELT